MQKTVTPLAVVFGQNVKTQLKSLGYKPTADNLRDLTKVGQGGCADILKGAANVRLSTVEKVAKALRVEPPLLLMADFAPKTPALSPEEAQQVQKAEAILRTMTAAQVQALRKSEVGKMLTAEPFPPDQMSAEWDASNKT